MSWRRAHERYLDHIMACRECHPPVGHYCTRGETLRGAYHAALSQAAQALVRQRTPRTMEA